MPAQSTLSTGSNCLAIFRILTSARDYNWRVVVAWLVSWLTVCAFRSPAHNNFFVLWSLTLSPSSYFSFTHSLHLLLLLPPLPFIQTVLFYTITALLVVTVHKPVENLFLDSSGASFFTTHYYRHCWAAHRCGGAERCSERRLYFQLTYNHHQQQQQR